LLDDVTGAVLGVAFFVTGDEKGNGTGVIGVGRHKALTGGNHGGEAAFHVGRAPAV